MKLYSRIPWEVLQVLFNFWNLIIKKINLYSLFEDQPSTLTFNYFYDIVDTKKTTQRKQFSWIFILLHEFIAKKSFFNTRHDVCSRLTGKIYWKLSLVPPKYGLIYMVLDIGAGTNKSKARLFSEVIFTQCLDMQFTYILYKSSYLFRFFEFSFMLYYMPCFILSRSFFFDHKNAILNFVWNSIHDENIFCWVILYTRNSTRHKKPVKNAFPLLY